MDHDAIGTEVGLGTGHNVLNGDHPAPERAQHPLTFRPMSIVAKQSPISATAELLFQKDIPGKEDDIHLYR